MFEAVLKFFSFGSKPSQADPASETTSLSEHEGTLPKETLRDINSTTLPASNPTYRPSLDGSSDEFEDETYTFTADVKDSANKEHSILAFYNPTSPENHISRGFATDIGVSISDPSSVVVSWSSSSLQRFDEATEFTVAPSESFKVLFGRENRTSWRETSTKQHSYEGERQGKAGQLRGISFEEGIKQGILWPLEIADSDCSESENGRGPKVADVEARLQRNDLWRPVSLLERLLEQDDLAMRSTFSSHSDASEIERADSTSWHSGTRKQSQRNGSPRKPIRSSGPTISTGAQVPTSPSANPYAVLSSMASDSSNTSAAKKPKRRRQKPKKPNPPGDLVSIAAGKIYAISTSPEDNNGNYTAATPPTSRPMASGLRGYHDQSEKSIPRSSNSKKNPRKTVQPDLPFTISSRQEVQVTPVAQTGDRANHGDSKQSSKIQGRVKKPGNKKEPTNR